MALIGKTIQNPKFPKLPAGHISQFEPKGFFEGMKSFAEGYQPLVGPQALNKYGPVADLAATTLGNAPYSLATNMAEGIGLLEKPIENVKGMVGAVTEDPLGTAKAVGQGLMPDSPEEAAGDPFRFLPFALAPMPGGKGLPQTLKAIQKKMSAGQKLAPEEGVIYNSALAKANKSAIHFRKTQVESLIKDYNQNAPEASAEQVLSIKKSIDTEIAEETASLAEYPFEATKHYISELQAFSKELENLIKPEAARKALDELERDVDMMIASGTDTDLRETMSEINRNMILDVEDQLQIQVNEEMKRIVNKIKAHLGIDPNDPSTRLYKASGPEATQNTKLLEQYITGVIASKDPQKIQKALEELQIADPESFEGGTVDYFRRKLRVALDNPEAIDEPEVIDISDQMQRAIDTNPEKLADEGKNLLDRDFENTLRNIFENKDNPDWLRENLQKSIDNMHIHIDKLIKMDIPDSEKALRLEDIKKYAEELQSQELFDKAQNELDKLWGGTVEGGPVIDPESLAQEGKQLIDRQYRGKNYIGLREQIEKDVEAGDINTLKAWKEWLDKPDSHTGDFDKPQLKKLVDDAIKRLEGSE